MTGYTTVKLLYLRDDNGKFLDQESLNKNPKANFEKRQLVVKRTFLDEHISYIYLLF